MTFDGGVLDRDAMATAFGALKLYSEEEMDSVMAFPDHFDGKHLAYGMVGVAGTLLKLLPPAVQGTFGPSIRAVRVRRRLRKELTSTLMMAQMVNMGETVHFDKYSGRLTDDRWEALVMVAHAAVLATAITNGRNEHDLIMDLQRGWLN